MARQEVTLDEVTAAAISLQDDGMRVTIEAVREALGTGSPSTIHKHLVEWRASQAKPEAPKPEIPESIVADLGRWAQQFAQQAGAGANDALAQAESDMDALLKAGEELEAERDELLAQVASITSARDQALATAAEHAETIERLTVELRNARQVAMDALVGKAKDQLAIEGKDAQLAELRQQVERGVTASAAESDARLAAEMELIGATTARDNLAAEVRELRAQLDAAHAERSTLRAEMEVLRASR
ncbi:DNA-binding protein [Massilia horti]|nr:DNA-binding protein [Massilia horti]